MAAWNTVSRQYLGHVQRNASGAGSSSGGGSGIFLSRGIALRGVLGRVALYMDGIHMLYIRSSSRSLYHKEDISCLRITVRFLEGRRVLCCARFVAEKQMQLRKVSH